MPTPCTIEREHAQRTESFLARQVHSLTRILFALLLLALLPMVATAYDRGDVYRQAKAATALILGVDEETNSLTLGSGFFVRSDGLLLTNAHVVEGHSQLTVYVDNQDIYPNAEVVAIDRNLDLAAVRIPPTRVAALPLAPTPTKDGTDVIAVGYPRLPDILQMGLTLHTTVVSGTVSNRVMGRARVTGEHVPYLQTTGVFHAGNSGGPLVRIDTGEVAGMVLHTVPYMETTRDYDGKPIGNVTMKAGISYSIPVSVIAGWLRDNELDPEPSAIRPQAAGPLRIANPSPQTAEAKRFFATGHLVHTIALQLRKDQDLLRLATSHYLAAARRNENASWIALNLGLAFASLGEWDKVIATYTQGLERNPDDPALLTNIGYARQQSGDTDRAIQSYYHALSLRPCYLPAHNNLGVLLMSMKHFDEAIQEFRHASECEPASGIATYNLGIALESQGRPQDAAHTLERFLNAREASADQRPALLSKMRDALLRTTTTHPSPAVTEKD